MVRYVAESQGHEVARMASTLRMRLLLTVMPTALLFAASCARAPGPAPVASGADRSTKLIFLKEDDEPLPAIGRATEGRLSVNGDGCVFVEGPERYLIIWPPDATYNESDNSFSSTRSGSLRIGMDVSFTGRPVGPLKVTSIGGVEIPAACRQMSTLIVAVDGARKL